MEQSFVRFEGIEIPEEWLTTQPLYLEYITAMTPMQRQALQIAMTHLKTSFDLARSNGFVEWSTQRAVVGAAAEAASSTESR
jgi:hypothetical protein